jgi:MFS family permease
VVHSAEEARGDERGLAEMSVVSRRSRAASVAALAFGVLTLAAGLASVPLNSLTHQTGPGGPATDLLFTAAVLVPAAGVGTLLAARRPGNPLGWILLAIFLIAVAPVNQYAALDYRMHHGTLPLGWLAVTLGQAWPVFLFLIAVLLWLFPDGRLPAGRWRRTAVVALIAGALLGLAASGSGVAAAAGHDIHVNAAGSLLTEQGGIWDILRTALAFFVAASWLIWLAVQVPSYRHATGERRQQLKWLYSGAVVFVIAVFAGAQASGSNSGWAKLVSNLITPLGFLAFAACFAVAVLRYRLYEIDRIVSRVISYAIVTAVLAGVFAGLVLLATVVLPVKTPVAVAAATLAAAALFNRLRRRVQHAVDRRFNRARYNAEAIVAAFTARLRQTVDLDTVRGDLVGVVQEAFQPAQVSLWLAGTLPYRGDDATPTAAKD